MKKFIVALVVVSAGFGQQVDWRSGIRNKPFIDVKSAPYNAIGNGTTDDTVAVQAAITAASSGQTVLIPTGTYLVSGLTSTAKVRIECTGGAKLYLKNSSNLPVLHFSGSAHGSEVIGCEIDGNLANNGTPGPNGNVGILFNGVNDCRAERNYSHHNKTTGFAIYSGDRNQIVNNRSTANVRAVWIYGATSLDNVVSNNSFTGDDNGIQVYTVTNGNNKIQNNHVSYTTETGGTPGVLACIAALDAGSTHISGNTLVGCGSRGILVFNSSNSVINNNKIFSAGTTATLVVNGSGIDTDDSSYLTITGNHVIGSKGAGIVVVNTQYSTIGNNYLNQNGTWCATNPADALCAGISMLWESGSTTSYNVIIGNVILNNNLYGIREDDYAARDASKFLQNIYSNNHIYLSGSEDLSIVSITSSIAGNIIPSLYAENGFVANTVIFRGSLKLRDPGAKLTCTDATNRGMIWNDNGGAGVKDTVEICAKDATDTYAWRTIY